MNYIEKIQTLIIQKKQESEAKNDPFEFKPSLILLNNETAQRLYEEIKEKTYLTDVAMTPPEYFGCRVIRSVDIQSEEIIVY